MTTFLRLLSDQDKQSALLDAVQNSGKNVFEVNPDSFKQVPGAPFAYWVSDAVRGTFQGMSSVEGAGKTVRVGLQTGDDFRFVRGWWEVSVCGVVPKWFTFAKGGSYSPFYADVYLAVNWKGDGRALAIFSGSVIRNPSYYLHPGLTWPRRTNGLSFRVMPAGCIFADKGPAAFVENDEPQDLLALSCLLNSSAFGLLVSVQLARVELAQSFEVGLIQQTPIPNLSDKQSYELASLARCAWSLKRKLDTVQETSHAFTLPAALRARLRDYNPPVIQSELVSIQDKINRMAFDLYGFNKFDQTAAYESQTRKTAGDLEVDVDNDGDDEDSAVPVDQTAGLLSWAVGVAFGRFDWRLATGKRDAPAEPEPFDPLPAKSPGMLPDGAEPFHAHAGILVDDPGHPHDLTRLIEEVLSRVDVAVPDDVRRWLRKDFFAFHLQRYSKSRRKAPIYWPLSTVSGSYTLWIYYPALNNQTLFTAVNDFLDGPTGKLTQISRECSALRLKTGRSSEEEKQYASLQTFEQELTDLRDTLLKIAPTYQPNHDDGVQITAAPLWPLFRHKPWQKILKETWGKLEKGDYDWAHLAMNYWPDSVREKCKTDKSLAIAHGLEHLYIEPEVVAKKPRIKKKTME